MKRRSRAGSVKSRHRKTAALKRGDTPKVTRRRGASIAGQATIVARLTHERDDALLREAANCEILSLISKSLDDLELVFRTILEHITRICNANFGTLFRFDGQKFHPAAQFNTPTALLNIQRGAFEAIPGTPIDRVMRPKQVSQYADATRAETGSLAAKFAGARSLVAVPMLKDDQLLGVIVIYRQEVLPFTDKQIALVQNFAAQAVIAIENTRLLNELRQRTADLSESLQQQTATADVLRIINSSAGKLEPVFQAILENAVRICEANLGFMVKYDGETFYPIANVGGEPAFLEFVTGRPLQPGPETVLGRVKRSMQTVQVEDLAASRGYAERDPIAVAAVELARVRTFLGVPMIRDDKLVGIVLLYRQEVGLFSEKHVELVENFAAQAVIAIENARLLNELRQRTADLGESLEQQTATSEVLKIISSSPGDLQPVFSAMLESAARLCNASFGNIFRWEDDALRLVATYNTPAAFVEARSQFPLRRNQNNPIGEMLAAKTVLHVHDLAADE